MRCAGFRLTASVVLAAATASAALRTAAVAATLDISNQGLMTYVAGAAVINNLSVALAGSTYVVDDAAEAAVSIQPGASLAGCVPVDANTVGCPAAAITAMSFVMLDGADTVNLATVTVPTTTNPGDANDWVTGGLAADTFTWNPGDDNDILRGGGGGDTLQFNSANVNESITITANGTGFLFFRDVGSVSLDVDEVEILSVATFGGVDTVTTLPLAGVLQVIDGGVDAALDRLVVDYDAQDHCVSNDPGVIAVDGVPSILYSHFDEVALTVSGNCDPIFRDGFEGGNPLAWSSFLG